MKKAFVTRAAQATIRRIVAEAKAQGRDFITLDEFAKAGITPQTLAAAGIFPDALIVPASLMESAESILAKRNLNP